VFFSAIFLSFPPMAFPAIQPETLRFQITPWAGVSTIRLGGLDSFAVPAVDLMRATWRTSFGEKLVKQEIQGVNWAAMNGVDVWYHVDQLVKVGMKFGYLRTSGGYMKTTTSGPLSSHLDEWNWSSDFMILGAGAGFMLPVDKVSRFSFNLSLGTAWTTVYISHRNTSVIGGFPSFMASDARGTGTGFFPEFALDYERDFVPGVVFGGRLGYRFGAVHEFRHAYSNTVNVVNGGEPETIRGDTVRSADRAALLVDYGGIYLNLAISSRF